MSIDCTRHYFQCSVTNGIPDVEKFGKTFVFKLNHIDPMQATLALVQVCCFDEEWEEKELTELTKQEAWNLSKSWDE